MPFAAEYRRYRQSPPGSAAALPPGRNHGDGMRHFWHTRLRGARTARARRVLPAAAALLAFFCCLWARPLAAAPVPPLDFTLTRLGDASGPVALVVGGIQGDEPGGFSAATLLTTHYTIRSGGLWVVPNLNFPSIIKRSRGLYGDMNRKFARLDDRDPEYGTVRRIQDLIRHPRVVLVLNLHDGSGYYRPVYEDRLRNAARWGQSVIIDQERLPGVFMGDLAREAQEAAAAANKGLLDPAHRLHVHNTRTAEGDREMEKSLSYYAVRQGKAAFGLEASKEFPVELRAYYHLCMVESLLRQAGVAFTRGFELSPEGVRGALLENLGVSFADNRIFLPLEDVRPTINYLPLPKEAQATAVPSKPIMAVLPCERDDGQYCVHYGNRMITLIRPEWREVDTSLSGVRARVDGKDVDVPFGRVLDVRAELLVQPQEGVRVNAIGVDSGEKDESGQTLRRKDFLPRFSVDRQGRIFRVEVYRGQRCSGMFLVRFAADAPRQARAAPLPDRPGPESALGF